MPESRSPRLRIQPNATTVAILLLIYLLAGLFGHDPWKVDDARHFGIVWSLLRQGDWLPPTLVGEPYLAPPLYHWVAALAAGAVSDWLPVHDGARVASALFTGIGFVCLYHAARELYGKALAIAAPLALAGCIGLLPHAHETQPLTAVLAAECAMLYGLALFPRRPIHGGLALGAAAGVAFFAAGLALPLPALLIAAGLVAVGGDRRRAALGWVAAVVAALAIALPWPLLLRASDPNLFSSWWQHEIAYFGAQPQPAMAGGAYLAMLVWYAWPALPLSAWSLWSKRRELSTLPLALPLTAWLLALTGLATSFDVRPSFALPLLPPLALLATPGLPLLRRGAANAFDWFGMMTFGFFALVLWVGGSALAFGWPARLAARATALEPGFVGRFDAVACAVALAATVAWGWIIFTSPRSPFRGLVNWMTGLTLVWLLAMTLWLPWIDYGKSYRQLAESLAAALPADHGCVAAIGLGDAQLASLDYFAGIAARRDTAAADRCDLLLTQGSRDDKPAVGAAWQPIWEGHRPSDRSERFRLYRRADAL